MPYFGFIITIPLRKDDNMYSKYGLLCKKKQILCRHNSYLGMFEEIVLSIFCLSLETKTVVQLSSILLQGNCFI